MILDNVQSHICSPQVPEVLILTPTRELALQIMKEAKKFCMKTPFDTQTLYGGTSVTHQFRQFTSKNVNIVAATPGRFLQGILSMKVYSTGCSTTWIGYYILLIRLLYFFDVSKEVE